MKSFNLADALAGKPVVTRDGKEAKVFFFSDHAGDRDYPIKGAYLDESGWNVDAWTSDAKYDCYDDNSDLDLFMKTEKKKLYIAIMKQPTRPNANLYFCENAYESITELTDKLRYNDVFDKYQIVEVEIEV